MPRAGRIRGLALPVLLVASMAGSEEQEPDLTEIDLSGDWYVLVHYKDDDSADKSITKFKDVVWTIEQTPNSMAWEEYPYVVFSDDQELYRRQAMQEHLPWEPDASGWERIREGVEVSSRAMKRKRLKGSVAEGYSSLPALGTGGFTTMTFESTWTVTFEPRALRLEIVDSLSGAGLEGMEGSTVYEVREAAGPDELRGRFDRETLHGKFRMVRSRARRVVK